MNNQADKQYNRIVENIMVNGIWDTHHDVRTRWGDGIPAYTKSTISQSMKFDNTEIPILTSKKVAWKTAIKELLWIWQLKSNKVQDLRNMGVNIWNEWELEDGTIGLAYGGQLAKLNRRYPIEKIDYNLLSETSKFAYKTNIMTGTAHMMLDQVDYLLQELKNNPSSRRHITMLWNPDDLDEMSLTPCVYETQWHVKNNKLSLEVRSRSNDMALGNPFNVFQYNMLQRMFAQVLGYELGDYDYTIGDAHYYDRHEDNLRTQMDREFKKLPELRINQNVRSFYDFTIDDFELFEYEYGDKLNFEVAI